MEYFVENITYKKQKGIFLPWSRGNPVMAATLVITQDLYQ